MIDYKELAKTIHENAKAKGFYDKSDDLCFEAHQQLEIIKEICEFHEAYKKGKTAKDKPKGAYYGEDNILFFQKHIKDTYEDELADIVIRGLDFLAFKDDLEIIDNDILHDGNFISIKGDYDISLHCYTMISDVYSNYVFYVIDNVFMIARTLGVDLEWHIRAKMEYNTSRERLHGKNF